MNNNLKTIPTLLIAIALLLAACASPLAQATNAPTDPSQQTITIPAATPTQAPANTNPAPAGTSTTDPVAATSSTAAPTEGIANTGSTTTYKVLPDQSKVSYEVNETFINENNRLNTAIGVSQVISGGIMLDAANPQNSSLSTFTVDISKFVSDSRMRDNRIRNSYLESARYPTVTFVPKQIEGLPSSYTPGQEINFKVNGDLTIRDTTKPATFDVTAKLDQDTLTGTATTTLLMSDFGFGPISILGMLKTEDKVNVTFVFTAKP